MPESKSNSHMEELADGNIGAWYTDEHDEDTFLGAFKDERHAQFAIDGALETAEARRSDNPKSGRPKAAVESDEAKSAPPKAQAPPAKKTTS